MGVRVDLGLQNPIFKAPEALQGVQGGENWTIDQNPKKRAKNTNFPNRFLMIFDGLQWLPGLRPGPSGAFRGFRRPPEGPRTVIKRFWWFFDGF